MYDLTGFQRDLLYCVASLNEPSGAEIRRELEAYNAAEVNHGRLYPNLNDLVDEGVIEKGNKDDRTNLYTLTPLGRELIEERRQWEDAQLEDIDIALS